MRKVDPSGVKRILIITLSNVGDIVLTTPVAEAIIKEFPGAALDVMVGPNGKEIFESHEKIAETVIYDKKSPFSEKFALFRKLRKKKYDLIVDLRNTIFPVILDAKFITNPFRPGAKNGMHKSKVHLSRLKEIGIDTSGGKFHIPVSAGDRERGQELLSGLGNKPFVVIAPGGKNHVKKWNLKNFARLADMIKENLGLKVVLIGDANDRIVIERVLFYMKTTPLNLIEKTNIPELAFIIKKSKLLVTNDSAPLHIGSAVNARILAFFGPTDPAQYGPATREKSKVLRKNIDCSPCNVPQCINAENKYECLKTISVEEAFQAAKGLL